MEANIVAHFIHGKITADSVSAMQLLVATHEAEHQFDQLKPSVFFTSSHRRCIYNINIQVTYIHILRTSTHGYLEVLQRRSTYSGLSLFRRSFVCVLLAPL